MRARKADTCSINRLSTQAVFDCLRTTKTRWVSTGFALQAVPKAQEASSDPLRFCIIASKKTAKLATVRNRMRRRLRAIALDVLPLYAAPHMDYMIVARATAGTRDFDDLRNDMVWCLKRLNLLQEPRESVPDAP